MHHTMGIAVWILQLAVETVVYVDGNAARQTSCVQLDDLLRAVAVVTPASHFGGAFERNEIRRTSDKKQVIELLDWSSQNEGRW